MEANFFDVCFDMETGDPDDVISLLILLAHPRVRLRAVTICPGGKDQIGFVRRLIKNVQDRMPKSSKRPISIGGYKDWSESPQTKKYLSKGISRYFPEADTGVDEEGDAQAHQVLADTISKFGPQTLIITGGPVSNIAALLNHHPEVSVDRIVCQGGFAGDNVVPEEVRLAKFKGLNEMSTWNLGGDIPAAKAVIASESIKRRIFVSKNVCHGVVYTEELHQLLKDSADGNAALESLLNMMVKYKETRPNKAMHDPLAVCVALNPQIVELAPVELYHVQKGNAWGSRPSPHSSTFISTALKDPKLFMETFCCRA